MAAFRAHSSSTATTTTEGSSTPTRRDSAASSPALTARWQACCCLTGPSRTPTGQNPITQTLSSICSPLSSRYGTGSTTSPASGSDQRQSFHEGEPMADTKKAKVAEKIGFAIESGEADRGIEDLLSFEAD